MSLSHRCGRSWQRFDNAQLRAIRQGRGHYDRIRWPIGAHALTGLA
jgi:hypothetical protein